MTSPAVTSVVLHCLHPEDIGREVTVAESCLIEEFARWEIKHLESAFLRGDILDAARRDENERDGDCERSNLQNVPLQSLSTS